MQQNVLSLSETMPLLGAEYPPNYLLISNRFHALLTSRVFSKETNQLAQKLISFNEGNYNCWYAKKECLLAGIISVESEYEYSSLILKRKQKSFQIWQHRRFLTQISGLYEQQLHFIEAILTQQSKNYHAWSYRTWIVSQAKNFSQQLAFTSRLIHQDVYNNSVWAYRRHLITCIFSQQPQIADKLVLDQVQYAKSKIKTNMGNEASWNYLRGFFKSIELKNIPSQRKQQLQPIVQYDFGTQKLSNFCRQILKMIEDSQAKKSQQNVLQLNKAAEIQCLITLLHINAAQKSSFEYARSICDLLSQLQPQKGFYYKWVKNHIE